MLGSIFSLTSYLFNGYSFCLNLFVTKTTENLPCSCISTKVQVSVTHQYWKSLPSQAENTKESKLVPTLFHLCLIHSSWDTCLWTGHKTVVFPRALQKQHKKEPSHKQKEKSDSGRWWLSYASKTASSLQRWKRQLFEKQQPYLHVSFIPAVKYGVSGPP